MRKDSVRMHNNSPRKWANAIIWWLGRSIDWGIRILRSRAMEGGSKFRVLGGESRSLRTEGWVRMHGMGCVCMLIIRWCDRAEGFESHLSKTHSSQNCVYPETNLVREYSAFAVVTRLASPKWNITETFELSWVNKVVLLNTHPPLTYFQNLCLPPLASCSIR